MLTGCAVVPPSDATGIHGAEPSAATPSAATSPAQPSPTAPAPTIPKPPPVDRRKGQQLDTPFTVDGVIMVSKEHPITAAYVPEGKTGPHQLVPEAAAALNRMSKAARAAGLRLVVRSGYRSYATQASLYRKQLASYPSAELARRYNARAGRSEHQTGLAVDLWDGVTWGLGVRNTAVGKWLWRHSREYGFILRYPPGKEKITGYAYEPWHFRFIGTEHSLRFKPESTKTLEEYLGLAR